MSKLILSIFLVIVFAFPKLLYAEQPDSTSLSYEAEVEKILEEKQIDVNEKKQLYQKLELRVTNKGKIGRQIWVENGNVPQVNVIPYKVGDKVVVFANKDLSGEEIFFITDFVRRDALYQIAILLCALLVLIARKKGIQAIGGMVFSFLVIFKFIIPQLLSGKDPVVITLVSSLVIIPVTFYLSHGISKKTTSAVISTFVALIITSLVASFYINSGRLSGYASEEAGFLQVAKNGFLNIKGLLFAGIVIGLLGILNDITVSQAAIVEQLKRTDPGLKFKELYTKAMSIGKDHIASMVNTLILVYAGSALPLLLLFVDNPHPFTEIINYEIVSEEIIKSMVSSIGLILAVPITTFIAAIYHNR